MSVLERDVVALCEGDARCDVAPQAGGALAGFWWERDGRRIDWLRPASATDVARGAVDAMACFPLVPWGNRIRDGRFQFCGREVAQPGGGTHALHGHGWRRPWQVIDRTAERVELDYVHEPDEWPWRYRACQTVALARGAVSLTLEVVNLSDEVMPAGLGFHPYFPSTANAAVQAAARSVWLTDADKLPRECVPVPASWDFTAGRRLAELELDNVFAGWNGKALISWPERAHRLVIEGDWPMLSFLAVYQPPSCDWFCVEPMSHCPDAINLARDGAADTGLRVLAPGARRGATMTLRPYSG